VLIWCSHQDELRYSTLSFDSHPAEGMSHNNPQGLFYLQHQLLTSTGGIANCKLPYTIRNDEPDIQNLLAERV
jgi:hypothetical protein